VVAASGPCGPGVEPEIAAGFPAARGAQREQHLDGLHDHLGVWLPRRVGGHDVHPIPGHYGPGRKRCGYGEGPESSRDQ
jgi:hypothetical protein